jgi:hypothetical protein
MAFVHRQISLQLILGQGQFGESGTDTVKLSGPLRASARVSISGGPAMAQLDPSVYGMTLDHMNKLATMGPIMQNIICDCIYNPNISIGKNVKVESTIALANGQWTIEGTASVVR